MNNKCFIFRSYVLTTIYVYVTGGKNITQGPYNVIDLIHRFSNKEYTSIGFKKEIVNVAYNYGRYNFQANEYYMYNVESLSKVGKRKYITEITRWSYYDKLNRKENLEFFDDKEKNFQLFKKYYNRDLVAINDVEDSEKYNEFFKNHNRIILKPLRGSGGKDVRLLDKSSDSFEGVLQEYGNGFVMEEQMENVKELAEFHKESLNTIRVITVRMDDRVEVVVAFARFGRGGKCIDNLAAGGVLGAIDIESGIIYDATNRKRERLIVHPDSKKLFLGYKIPRWNELILLVEELANVVPTNRYTGWDLALTDLGWTLVEANARAQFSGGQLIAREGLKIRFDNYLEELNI